jgi:hypothetical protein
MTIEPRTNKPAVAVFLAEPELTTMVLITVAGSS